MSSPNVFEILEKLGEYSYFLKQMFLESLLDRIKRGEFENLQELEKELETNLENIKEKRAGGQSYE